MQMPLNRALRGDDGKIYDAIAGPFFICGLGEDDFCSLPKSFRVSTLRNSAGRRSSSPLAATLSLCRISRARVRTSRQLRSADVEVSSCRRRLSSGTLTLVINGTKFSGRVLKNAVSKFVAFCRNQKSKKVNVHPKGKQSVKQLTRQGQGREHDGN